MPIYAELVLHSNVDQALYQDGAMQILKFFPVLIVYTLET